MPRGGVYHYSPERNAEEKTGNPAHFYIAQGFALAAKP